MQTNHLNEIMKQFQFEGEFQTVEGFGNGHINDTYRLQYDQHCYVVQRINHEIFTKPDQLMNNVVLVTQYIRDIVEAEGGDVDREVLRVIQTKDQQNLYKDSSGNYWRAYAFISDSFSYNLVEKADDFYQSGLAFGNFQYQLRDFPVEKLAYTIENFHHTPSRFDDFVTSVNKDVVKRVNTAKEAIQFVLDREDFTHLLWDLHDKGELSLKVTHNDTKLNNVLMDKRNGKALCVVDLDTVMPGFALDDFGDSIRFGASTALEDEQDLTKVNLSLEYYEAFTRGFYEGANGTLTETEIRYFPEGAKMMTLECGIRFLKDYLDGDIYFKTAYSNHNLVRALTQFKLVSEMEKHWDTLKEISEKLLKNQ